MDPVLEKKINEALQLSRDNNQMLHKMERRMFWGRVFRILYWAIIIGSAVGLYFFLDPYVGAIKEVYQNFGDQVSNFSEFFNRTESSTQ